MNAEARRLEAIRLLSLQSWLALATVDHNGVPALSYIPFAIDDAGLGIVASGLAAHTAPLLARRPASVLLVDTETSLSDAYTRTRFSIGVTASPQPAGSASAERIWSALERRQGETIRMLRTLPDFNAIRLEPINGRLILGFAAAYDLSGPEIAELLENAR